MLSINKVVSVNLVPMPERMMDARQIDWKSEEFKAQFPQGIPCVDIVLEGVDVEYDFGEGNIRHVTIEMLNFQGANIGKTKGEGSKLHVTTTACEDVLGHGLFGKANREALVGKIAVWGQHMDSFKDDKGNTRRFRWDVPRELLPDDYVFTGEVRKVQGRAQRDGAAGGGASATATGVATLSDDEALVAILNVAVGKPTDEADAITAEAMAIPGLPNDWAQACLDDELLKQVFERGLIDAAGDTIVATDAGKALIAQASTPEPVAAS